MLGKVGSGNSGPGHAGPVPAGSRWPHRLAGRRAGDRSPVARGTFPGTWGCGVLPGRSAPCRGRLTAAECPALPPCLAAPHSAPESWPRARGWALEGPHVAGRRPDLIQSFHLVYRTVSFLKKSVKHFKLAGLRKKIKIKIEEQSRHVPCRPAVPLLHLLPGPPNCTPTPPLRTQHPALPPGDPQFHCSPSVKNFLFCSLY